MATRTVTHTETETSELFVSAADLAGGEAVTLELPNFAGPLDLLLHLVREHKLDILDIPIAFVAARYEEYLDTMKRVNLEVASEYLVMAAHLAYIKSRILLPPSEPEAEETADEADPRAELIRRLLEYQKYKAAAAALAARPRISYDVFRRNREAQRAGLPEPGEVPLLEVSVFRLVELFAHVLARTGGGVQQEILVERISISQRIIELTEVFGDGHEVDFYALFKGYRTRYDIILTFLAILEMAKLRMLRISQPPGSSSVMLALAAQDGGEAAVHLDAGYR